MRTLLDLFGYLILLGGTVVGLMSGSVALIVISIVGGMVLLALSHLIGIAENLQARFLELPPTLATVRSIIKNAPEYTLEARLIELHPSEDAKYALVELDGDAYMRTRAFWKHLTVADSRYTFELPDRPPVELHCANSYFKGAELFAVDGHAYVLLSAIGLGAVRDNDRIVLEPRSAISGDARV